MPSSVAIQIAKSVVNGVPLRKRRRARQALVAGYDPAKDSADYARRVYERHEPFVRTRGRILEIGPGGNLATAALYVKSGAASAVCIDSTPWATAPIDLYRALDIEEDTLKRVAYVAPTTAENAPLAAGTFDAIYSQATLEHVRDPSIVVANIARWLQPGGRTSHQIDLRDHRDFRQPLEFLRHSAATWRLLSLGTLMPTNRWRMSDWLSAFAAHGLTVTHTNVDISASVSESERRQFAKPFREMALADLSVLSVQIVAVKAPN